MNQIQLISYTYMYNIRIFNAKNVRSIPNYKDIMRRHLRIYTLWVCEWRKQSIRCWTKQWVLKQHVLVHIGSYFTVSNAGRNPLNSHTRHTWPKICKAILHSITKGIFYPIRMYKIQLFSRECPFFAGHLSPQFCFKRGKQCMFLRFGASYHQQDRDCLQMLNVRQ